MYVITKDNQYFAFIFFMMSS